MTRAVSARRLVRQALLAVVIAPLAMAQAPRFEITVSKTAHAAPLTGRLVLVISKPAEPEPRLSVAPQGPAIFGVDLEQVPAERAVVVDEKSLGYP